MKYFFLLFALFFATYSNSQTSGAGYISSIESKANAIANLQDQIAQLEINLKRWRMEQMAQDDLLQKRLAEKLNEIENSQVWNNRLKSAQSGWREFNPGACGAGGPPPVCPVNHWHRVSVSDAMREYNALKNKELEKIHDATDRAKKEYADKIDKAERDVPKLYDDIDKLKAQIVEMSKAYKEVVVKSAKNVQTTYLAELMRIVAEKHFIEDRINIITVKISDLNAEETKALNESAEKVRRQNEEEKQKISSQVEGNKLKLQQLLQRHQSRLNPLKLEDGNLMQQLFNISKQLQNASKLTADEIKTLEADKTTVEDRIAQVKKNIESHETEYRTSKQQLENEIRELEDKKWKLTIDLSKRQQEASDLLKKAFTLRRKILEDAKVARQSNLQLTGELLLSKKAAARKKFMEYAADADNERVRLIRACQKAGCSCYGIDTHGTIVGNWNKAEGCVGEMEAAHFTTDPIYGCVEETAIYRQHYSSLINGLSDADIRALQRQSGKVRYDLILKKYPTKITPMKFYLFVALMLLSGITFGQTSAFDSIQLKVDECITRSQWDELLVTAPELITAEPTKPGGYFYTALAFHKLQENEKALEYLAMAEQLSDEILKTKIAALKVDIANTTKASKLAETLNKNGEDKNAADDNRKLWEMDKTKIEYALNAVELYIEKENYTAALEILTDPAMASDPQAKLLIAKINQKPKMITLNGYNKAMKEGDEKFKQESFQAAINKFDEAMTFYAKDVKASSYKRKAQEELAWQVAGKLNTVESYKSYLAKYPLGKYKTSADDILQRAYVRFAREKVKEKNFSGAVNYYQIYQNSYPKGPHISTVNSELCELYFAEAQKNEKEKNSYNMKLALEQHALAERCGIKRVSSAHLRSLKRKEVRWGRDDMTFLGWHADETNLLGMMSGSLNNRKLGMYVALRVSDDIMQAGDAYWETDNSNSVSGSVDRNKKYNGKSYDRVFFGTIGLTKKIAHPFWIYGGAGVAINSQVREFVHNNTGQIEYVKNKDVEYIAVNPEIGLQVRLAFLTLRYGINKPITPLYTEPFMQHFGAGIKF